MAAGDLGMQQRRWRLRDKGGGGVGCGGEGAMVAVDGGGGKDGGGERGDCRHGGRGGRARAARRCACRLPSELQNVTVR